MASIGIVGSRSFTDYDRFKSELSMLFDLDVGVERIISGGAKGADSLAERFAHENDIECVVFRADWGAYGKRAGYIRNETIVKNSDFIIAFWDGESKGTEHTIKLAKKYKIPISIIYTNINLQ